MVNIIQKRKIPQENFMKSKIFTKEWQEQVLDLMSRLERIK